jgi:polyphosphate kinase
MFPVEDRALKARLGNEVLGLAMQDRARARRLQPDGSYLPPERVPGALRSQQALCEAAVAARGLPRPTVLRQAPAPRIEGPSDRVG